MLKVITPPAISEADLEALKVYLRVDHDDEDDLIKSLMTATREYAEGTLCERSFEIQTLEYTHTRDQKKIWLPRPPLQSVEQITATLSDGGTQTITEFKLWHDGDATMAIVELDSLPEDWMKITVQYIAGFDSPPEEYKLWQKVMVAHYFENRNVMLSSGHFAAKTHYTADYLLQSYRMFRGV